MVCVTFTQYIMQRSMIHRNETMSKTVETHEVHTLFYLKDICLTSSAVQGQRAAEITICSSRHKYYHFQSVVLRYSK